MTAGPRSTAPEVTSNCEPWHWHMIVVPVSRPGRERAGLVGAQVVEGVQVAGDPSDRHAAFQILEVVGHDVVVR